MSTPGQNDLPQDRVAREAAAWVLRCDRGLGPGEQDEFSEWLAADPQHGAQLARHRRHWQRLDQLAQWRPEHGARPNRDLLAPPLRRRVLRFVPVSLALAAAAAIAFMVSLRQPSTSHEMKAANIAGLAPTSSQRVLDDGSVVELNRDASLSVAFTADERRVTLERGEAHFAVEKDAARPFIVRARGVDVRAVGTAFNVRVDRTAVEVLVTEGRVELDAQVASSPAAEAAGETSLARPRVLRTLEARQRAVVSLEPEAPAPQVATLTASEIERVLAWQHRMLDFTGAPLLEIVAEFNRRNVVQLVVMDPELASLRVSATLRSDNIHGFVRLLEAGFGTRAEQRGESEILLRRGK